MYDWSIRNWIVFTRFFYSLVTAPMQSRQNWNNSYRIFKIKIFLTISYNYTYMYMTRSNNLEAWINGLYILCILYIYIYLFISSHTKRHANAYAFFIKRANKPFIGNLGKQFISLYLKISGMWTASQWHKYIVKYSTVTLSLK